MVNWIEFTQLARRDENRCLRILEPAREEVKVILQESLAYIIRPEDHEYFQRKYGLDLEHTKDTRNFLDTKTITAGIIADQKIKQAFIIEALKSPINKISSKIIDRISFSTGIDEKLVERTLQKLYPRGAIGAFMTEYFEMAFKGRDEAIEFEKATVEIFKKVFGFEAEHVGPLGLTPDILILSNEEGYKGIIDNKAYSKYSITNDHRNRMIHNYIPRYNDVGQPLSFFTYIAGGFGKNINGQIKSIHNDTYVCGSAINVGILIKLIEQQENRRYSHKQLESLFSLNRQIMNNDILY